jgi:hypothetical protein
MNYWMLDLEFPRLAISQEIPADKRLRADAQAIKSICSGGDEKKARRNYDRVDTKFKPTASLLIMGNSELQVDEQDVMEHCISFSSAYQFTTKEDIERRKQPQADGTPANPLMYNAFRVKDDAIKTKWVKELAWRRATVMLMVDNYRDVGVELNSAAVRDDLDEEELGLRAQLLKRFQITGLETEVVLCDTVYDCFGSKFSKKKITVELASMGVVKTKSRLRDDTRNKQVFTGMYLPIDEVGEVDEDED